MHAFASSALVVCTFRNNQRGGKPLEYELVGDKVMNAETNGEIILEREGILITKTLAKFGPTTYAINGVGSIYIGQKRSPVLIWVAVISGLIAIATFGARDSSQSAVPVIALIVAVLALIGYFAQRQFLMLSISSGDKQAFASTNYELLQEIKAAIETAVTLRG